MNTESFFSPKKNVAPALSDDCQYQTDESGKSAHDTLYSSRYESFRYSGSGVEGGVVVVVVVVRENTIHPQS